MCSEGDIEVRVHAEVCGRGKLTDEDCDVPGVYLVKVDAALTEPQMASAALDAFHDSIAVGDLERFSFRVTLDGRDLDEAPAHDSYSLTSRARVVGKVDE